MLNAEGNVDRFQGRMGNFTTFLKGAVIGGIASVGIALGGMAIKGVTSSDELQKALNGLQASTGATSEEMIGLEDSLLNIYNNNFGESFQDIAESMASVKQATGLAGEELEKATQNALMLRDTFGFEVNESVRSVDMMMKQFGITSEEAFNLLAQGSQNGLDKNGNLLDSINEYSVHFKQLGFDSEEMFNMMVNGAKSGVFDIDKLGDAMKEFGIRSKDGSKASTEAFQALGLDAQKMSASFAEGGDSAKQAFEKTIQALFALEDPLEKEATGVALFGTMWEDLSASSVEALTNTQGEISKTTDALSKINEVKYDSIGEAITGIGRNLETGILLPIGEQVLPIINELASWFQANMPQIQAISGSTLNFIGELFSTLGGLIGAFIGILQFMYTQNQEIFDGIAQVIQTAFDIIMGIFKATTALLQGDWDSFGKELSNLTDNIFKLIENIFKLGFTTIKTILNNAIGNFKTLGNLIMTALYNAFRGVWSSITSWLSSAISSAVFSVKNFASSFYNAGSQIFSFLWDGLKSVWNSISSWISSKISWIRNQLTSWRSAQSEMSSGGGNDNYPAYAQGTPFVPTTGLALLHQGEAIIPKEYNVFAKGGSLGGGTVNQTYNLNPSITINVKDAFDVSKHGDKIANLLYQDISDNFTKLAGVKI